MPIKIKNTVTNEIVAIKNTIRNNQGLWVFSKNNPPGAAWLGKWPCFTATGRCEGTAPNYKWELAFIEGMGYELVDSTTRKPRKPRKPKQGAPQVPQDHQQTESSPQEVPQPTPQVPQPTTTDKDKDEVDTIKRRLYARYGRMGEDIFAAAVEACGTATTKPEREEMRKVIAAIISEYAAEQPKAVKLAAKKVSSTDEVYCEGFDDIVSDVADGFHVYLYGPAGSGKSHTAEQIAEKLGLDFYGQTTIQFAHDVRGYGDAGGNYQDTPFYKAFKNGGLYFQDEYDRSNAEAAIVLNSALANGWYDFPIVGRVEAHPNFRFIAAGNTKMTGPDEEYVTGQVMDASSRDRFATMYEIGYLRAVELRIANGNAEWVDFVEDVRNAIAKSNIRHIVSYRATKYAAARYDSDKKKVLQRSTFKGMDADEIRIIYGELTNKENAWAKAMRKIF